MSEVDSRAIVSASARLGQNVRIGAFAFVGDGVEMGDDCVLEPHAVVRGPARIGRANVFDSFCSVGGDPQDLKFGGEHTELIVGDANRFREFCTVSRGTTGGGGVTRIGNDNLFMAYTHVAHDCTLGNNIVMVNYAGLAGHVDLGDWVILSGYTGVHQFCKIGAHAFTAALSGVTRDVPPYIMAVGQPAVPHSINAEGLRRRGFTAEQIRNLRNAYRILYRSDQPLAVAVEQLATLAPSQPELRPLIDFIAASERSLIR